jgi:hypothetical protein
VWLTTTTMTTKQPNSHPPLDTDVHLR